MPIHGPLPRLYNPIQLFADGLYPAEFESARRARLIPTGYVEIQTPAAGLGIYQEADV